MTWFESLVGFQEKSPDQVRENLAVADGMLTSRVNGQSYRCGDLTTPSLSALREVTAPLSAEKQGGPLTVAEVVGDVQELHQLPENNGALFQVASQFNLLEMVGPGVTPEQGVGIYEHDRTQGPACAIACGAATIYRNYFAEVEGQLGQSATKQIDCAADLGAALGNQDGQLWTMRNGYLLASAEGLRTIGDQLNGASEPARDSLRETLRIGIQHDAEVTLGGNGNRVSQAFCSAVPVAYSHHSSKLWEPLARLVLEASYEGTFHAGVANFSETGNPRVFLTLLGGGAFGNLNEWIFDAIDRSLQMFSDSGLEVKLVSYGHSNFDVQQLVKRFQP